MHIKELTMAEFDNFAKTSPLGSYHQSSNYALFMADNNYDYDLIGLYDELDVLKAAALILIKKIGLNYKYGYSPKGFLIDYFDYNLLETFTAKIKEYYQNKLVFIKINPEIAIGEINPYSKLTNYNQNIVIRDYLKELGYAKLKDNLYFESILPRFNGIINLEEYDFNKLSKNTKNKIRQATRKGLVFEKADKDQINILYDFIKKKKNINNYYYNSYYNIFDRTNSSDLFLVKIDYEKYLLSSKEQYEKELAHNNILSNNVLNNPTDLNINAKMNSDKALLAYKNDIDIARSHLNKNETTYIAGAFVIKYLNRINIVISGIDPSFRRFNANYFLHYKIIEHYKDNYKFLDLNGLTGDFTTNNPYKGLNDFKIGFNPHIYEFIGEFDFIINPKAYDKLKRKSILAKEFNK